MKKVSEMNVSLHEQAENEARWLVRECGHNLNEAMTVALRRAGCSGAEWERWGDGYSALTLANDTAVVRVIESMIRGES